MVILRQAMNGSIYECAISEQLFFLGELALFGYLYDEPNPEPQHAVKELGLSPDEHGEVDQNLLNRQGQGSLSYTDDIMYGIHT